MFCVIYSYFMCIMSVIFSPGVCKYCVNMNFILNECKATF